VIMAEGEAQSARLISAAIKDDPGFLQMRRIAAAKEVRAERNRRRTAMHCHALLARYRPSTLRLTFGSRTTLTPPLAPPLQRSPRP
jgi:hypothetical protein